MLLALVKRGWMLLHCMHPLVLAPDAHSLRTPAEPAMHRAGPGWMIPPLCHPSCDRTDPSCAQKLLLLLGELQGWLGLRLLTARARSLVQKQNQRLYEAWAMWNQSA